MAGGLDASTKLLVHSDGSDGSYAVIDSGFRSAMGGTQPGGNLGTLVGTAAISAVASKFGGASLLCDGTGDYVTVPDHADWDIVGSANSATVDLWVKHTDHVGTETYVCQYEDANNYWTLNHLHGTGLQFIVQSGASTVVSVAGAEITDTNWHHVAVVKNGTTYTIYLDGTGGSPTTDTSTDTFAGALNIGSLGGGSDFDGYIDEVRLSRGVARWTVDFTSPTTAYTADGKTNLLLHFDAADSPFTGATAKVGTFVGTAMHKPNDAAVAMIGNGSLLLDGTGDYVTAADSADWDIVGSAGSATVDLWVKHTDHAGTETYVAQYEDADNYWALGNIHGTGLFFKVNSGASIVVSVTGVEITDTNWHHVALVKNGTVYTIYLDGIGGTAVDDASTDTFAGLLDIGSLGGGSDFDGYIDELRICKGTAVWTANFIPSIVPYTNTTAANTVLLCHFDNYQIDSSASPHALTQVGTAYNTGDYVIGATSPAVGAGAWRFDGSDDYITYPDAADFSFGTGNFTVDFWFKPTTIGSLQCIASQYEGANDYWHMDITAANKLQMIFVDGSTTVGSYIMTSAISGYAVNTWYHFAFIRNGAGALMFVNGVSQTVTETTAFADVGNIAGVLQVGAYNAGNFIAGYVDNLRILKGTAAWTTTFTPPTTPYTGADIPTSGNGLYIPLDYNARDAGGSNHVPTYVSNTYGATARSRFTGSILLDGNSDYVTFVDSVDWTFGDGNFTIDFWAYFNSITGYMGLYGQRKDANNQFVLNFNQFSTSDHKIHLYCANSSTITCQLYTTGDSGITTGSWFHIAIVRSGSTGYIFVNGVSQAVTQFIAWRTLADVDANLYIGYDSGYGYFNGYIDELRVSKGIARWIANFTPPTEPYSLMSGPAGIKKISGVAWASVGKVIGVTAGNIKKVIGVA